MYAYVMYKSQSGGLKFFTVVEKEYVKLDHVPDLRGKQNVETTCRMCGHAREIHFPSN